MEYLMQEYLKDPTWSKETCQRVSAATGLSESQVYKWGWDQRNKKAEDEEDDEDKAEADEVTLQESNAGKLEPDAPKEDIKCLKQAIANTLIDEDDLQASPTKTESIILPHNMPGKDSNSQETDANKQKLKKAGCDKNKENKQAKGPSMLQKRVLRESNLNGPKTTIKELKKKRDLKNGAKTLIVSQNDQQARCS